MDISKLFLERYDPLYAFYLADVWELVSPEQMRERPHARVNSIAWNLWHMARGEDAGLNRFVVDGVQVLDEEPWMARMNVPWRHHGSEMTMAEVDELSQRIDLAALRAYMSAVEARTREIVGALDDVALDDVLTEAQVRQIVVDEGLAHVNAEGFVANYTGWSKGKCLFLFGLTHLYQHVGEIDVIASLVGVTFD